MRPVVTALGWLVEVLRPRPAEPPWARMIRAPLAICLPLGVGLATDNLFIFLPLSLGGLSSSLVDRGGPYLARVKRVSTIAVLGGALGLTVGLLSYGRGWVTVGVIVALSLVSAVISTAGNVGSTTGMQLLLYAVLATGPLGQLRPWWLIVGLFLVGAAWGLSMTALGWLFFRRAPEEQSVADAYRAIARLLSATGTERFEEERQNLTAALNLAYDDVLTARSALAGQDRRYVRLVVLLNQTHTLAEAAVTLAHEGTRLTPQVIAAVEAIADVIQGTTREIPRIPRPQTDTPGKSALWDELVAVTEVLSRGRAAADRRPPLPGKPLRERVGELLAEIRSGRQVRLFALRLTLCMGVAAVISEVLTLERSYWVMLTVAVVLKPDFGSVFARALQRGLGTMVGAVLGAVLLAVVPPGPLLLIPLTVLAFVIPYGISRNYGLFTTFLTPMVVLLIDLLTRAGWQLAEARLIDTALGCAVVILLGYAPWPSTWHAHVRPQFAAELREIMHYLERALGPNPTGRTEVLREVYQGLSDMRTVFQRALAEPAPISRQVTAWFPAFVASERIVDAITATAVNVQGGAVAPSEGAVRQLADALAEISRAVRTGTSPAPRPLPTEAAARSVAETIHTVRELLWRPEDYGSRTPGSSAPP
jgi:uncharacterized membrane protein YccC